MTTAQGLAVAAAYTVVVLTLGLALTYLYWERLKLQSLHKTLAEECHEES